MNPPSAIDPDLAAESRPSRSIFGRLPVKLLLLVFLPVLPALFLTIYSYLEQRDIEKRHAEQSVVALSQLAAANQEHFIKNVRQLLGTLASYDFLVTNNHPAFTHLNFSNLKKLSPDYLDFGLIETNGALFASSVESNSTRNFSYIGFFQRTLPNARFTIGELEKDTYSGKAALYFGYPVQHNSNAVGRVLYAALDLELLNQTAARLPLPEGGVISLVDRHGRVLAHWPEAKEWQGKSFVGTPTGEAILAQREGAFIGPSLNGTPRLFAVTPIRNGRNPSLYVITGIPTEISYAQANTGLGRNLIGLFLVVILAAAATVFYARKYILRPVKATIRATHSFSEGNWTARTGIHSGSGELYQLAQAFDAMADTLQKREGEIEHNYTEIQRLNKELEQRVKERTLELEEANKELEAFCYSVSHDLRAPLRHISGFIELVLSGSPNFSDKDKRHLGLISKSADHMAKLIDDLLLFSRTSRQELWHMRINMNELVAEAKEMTLPEAKDRNIQWVIEELPTVEGDRSLLRQVWTNLISNALKYSRDRNIATIEIRCREEDNKFIFSIKDNGVGFDMKYVDKLFGVFQRLHHAEEFEGTGIGLANIRRIISRHGGRTWAEGAVGVGATIYFTLPVKPE